jgi:hypothetical protein
MPPRPTSFNNSDSTNVSRSEPFSTSSHSTFGRTPRLLERGLRTRTRSVFTPLISRNLGVSKVPITFRIDGKRRSAEIPGILHMSVDPLQTLHTSGEMSANLGHPVWLFPCGNACPMGVGAAVVVGCQHGRLQHHACSDHPDCGGYLPVDTIQERSRATQNPHGVSCRHRLHRRGNLHGAFMKPGDGNYHRPAQH